MRTCLAVLICCVIGFSAVAHADEREDKRRHRAQAMWEEGAARYDLGKFDQAIDLFEKAYEVWPFPEILFNLCQGHRQQKNYERAIFYCRSYLRNKKDAENRSEVNELVVEMQAILDAQKQFAAHPPEGVQRPAVPLLHPDGTPASRPAQAPGPVDPWYGDSWGWSVTGGGAATAVVGGIVLWSASGLEDDAAGAASESDRRQLLDDADSRRLIGGVVLGVGVAATVAGVFMLVRNPREDDRPRQTTIVFGPSWFEVRGTF